MAAPAAGGAAGHRAVRRPAARRTRSQLNVNENPYGPSEAVVADVAAAVADATRTLNRYPDREFTALREDLAAYLGHGVTPAQVWAANGSNEVMLQILQAFGGPGRTAVSFAPTYSMYPEYARDAMTDWVVGHREEDFSLDVDHAVEVIAKHRPSVVLLPSPNNPTGTALPPGDGDRRVRGRRRGRRGRGDRRGLRRVPPGGHAQRAGGAARRRRTWSCPHDEQGVRAGGRPARLPGRLDRDHRRAPRRAAALPPVRGHPGRRAGGAPARRRAAGPGRRPARRARPHGGPGCASRG